MGIWNSFERSYCDVRVTACSTGRLVGLIAQIGDYNLLRCRALQKDSAQSVLLLG